MFGFIYRYNIVYKRQLEQKHAIFYYGFYNEYIVNRELDVCKRIGCDTISVLINGKLKFAHNTRPYHIQSIIKNNLRISNGPLGVGIYCWNINEKNKGFRPESTVVGLYEGEYLKCVHGYPKGEYLLLDKNKIIKLEKFIKAN